MDWISPSAMNFEKRRCGPLRACRDFMGDPWKRSSLDDVFTQTAMPSTADVLVVPQLWNSCDESWHFQKIFGDGTAGKPTAPAPPENDSISERPNDLCKRLSSLRAKCDQNRPENCPAGDHCEAIQDLESYCN
jgi:hypothetical protein